MVLAGTQPLLVDAHRYIAHPHMAVLADGTWLLVANRGPRRKVTMHPPQDPEFTNILMRSDDQGVTWSPPVVVPGYSCTGTECAGLTALPDGGVLLNQWRFRWHPWVSCSSSKAELQLREPLLADPAALMRGLAGSSELDSGAVALELPERAMPWARGGGTLTVYRSDDRGDSFGAGTCVATDPYTGGYGMRGAVVLGNGDIVLPLSDVPNYASIFAVRSSDGGRSWDAPALVAAASDCEYEEPAPILLPSGELLLLLRDNRSRSLHMTRSADGGHRWSPPCATGIAGYPAHLVALPNGRLVAVVGCRQPPYGITAFVSSDDGASWDIEHPHVVRDDLPNKDLGYPTAALCADGSLFVAYYHRDVRGITGLYATRVNL